MSISSIAALSSSAVVANTPLLSSVSETVSTASLQSDSSAGADSAAPQGQSAQNLNQNAVTNSKVIFGIGEYYMSNAIQSFGNDWENFKTKLAAQRPDLLAQKWDIVTDKGTLQIDSSSMSMSDKTWLTGFINQDKSLVDDALNMNTIMLSTFAGTATMASDDPLGMTLSSLTQNSIDGAVHFLALMADTDAQSYVQSYSSQVLGLASIALGSFQESAPDFMNAPFVQPVAGDIYGLSALQQITTLKGHHLTIAVPGNQQGAADNALLSAFKLYLAPDFTPTSAPDGNDPQIATTTASTASTDIADLIGGSNQYLDSMSSLIPKTDPDQETTALDAQLLAALGTKYRFYGEALNGENAATNNVSLTLAPDGSAAQADGAGSTSYAASTAAVGPGASADGSTPDIVTATGVGAIRDAYQQTGVQLQNDERSIASVMQTMGTDWNTTKAAIADERPDLLSDNWDFVTDDGTLEATSNSLSEEQKLWLTGMLNQNANLVSDAETVNQSLLSYYQKASDKISLEVGGKSMQVTVASLGLQSLDGMIPYLALMGGADPTKLIQQSVQNAISLGE